MMDFFWLILMFFFSLPWTKSFDVVGFGNIESWNIKFTMRNSIRNVFRTIINSRRNQISLIRKSAVKLIHTNTNGRIEQWKVVSGRWLLASIKIECVYWLSQHVCCSKLTFYSTQLLTIDAINKRNKIIHKKKKKHEMNSSSRSSVGEQAVQWKAQANGKCIELEWKDNGDRPERAHQIIA